MSDLLTSVVAPASLMLGVLVFGFAPGAVLRLIMLAFERDDPRRRELIGELRAVPRWERPFWVAEMIEVALFEGVWERVLWWATGRIVWRWKLGSGVESNRKYPDTFWIPDVSERENVQPGNYVRLMFLMRDGWGERMWVEVTERTRQGYLGELSNQPYGIPKLGCGDLVEFGAEHIIDIDLDTGHSQIRIEDVDEESHAALEAMPFDDGCAEFVCDACGSNPRTLS